MDHCSYCGKLQDAGGLKASCSGCQLVAYYCSQDCQKNDGGSHKAACRQIPQAQADWISLCHNSQWKFVPQSTTAEEELFFAKAWTGKEHENNARITEIVAPPKGMHRGALAPRWVFEVAEPWQESADDMSTYQRRMVCFLAGRFVGISRPSASPRESLLATHGVPHDGVRYWWRYWDNNCNVYEIVMVKWRLTVHMDEEIHSDDSEDESDGPPTGAYLPGDFSSEMTWMRNNQMSDIYFEGNSWGPAVTNFSEFIEHMWLWKHRKTSCNKIWDSALKRMEESIGIS